MRILNFLTFCILVCPTFVLSENHHCEKTKLAIDHSQNGYISYIDGHGYLASNEGQGLFIKGNSIVDKKGNPITIEILQSAPRPFYLKFKQSDFSLLNISDMSAKGFHLPALGPPGMELEYTNGKWVSENQIFENTDTRKIDSIVTSDGGIQYKDFSHPGVFALSLDFNIEGEFSTIRSFIRGTQKNIQSIWLDIESHGNLDAFIRNESGDLIKLEYDQLNKKLLISNDLVKSGKNRIEIYSYPKIYPNRKLKQGNFEFVRPNELNRLRLPFIPSSFQENLNSLGVLIENDHGQPYWPMEGKMVFPFYGNLESLGYSPLHQLRFTESNIKNWLMGEENYIVLPIKKELSPNFNQTGVDYQFEQSYLGRLIVYLDFPDGHTQILYHSNHFEVEAKDIKIDFSIEPNERSAVLYAVNFRSDRKSSEKLKTLSVESPEADLAWGLTIKKQQKEFDILPTTINKYKIHRYRIVDSHIFDVFAGGNSLNNLNGNSYSNKDSFFFDYIPNYLSSRHWTMLGSINQLVLNRQIACAP